MIDFRGPNDTARQSRMSTPMRRRRSIRRRDGDGRSVHFLRLFCVALEADHRCFKQTRLGTRARDSGVGTRGSSDVVSGGQPDLSPHIPKITKVRQSFALCVMIPDHNDPE